MAGAGDEVREALHGLGLDTCQDRPLSLGLEAACLRRVRVPLLARAVVRLATDGGERGREGGGEGGREGGREGLMGVGLILLSVGMRNQSAYIFR